MTDIRLMKIVIRGIFDTLTT